MTPKEGLSEDEKTIHTLEEICQNARAIRRAVNRILDHLHESEDKDDNCDPDTVSRKDLYDNDDMYYLAVLE